MKLLWKHFPGKFYLNYCLIFVYLQAARKHYCTNKQVLKHKNVDEDWCVSDLLLVHHHFMTTLPDILTLEAFPLVLQQRVIERRASMLSSIQVSKLLGKLASLSYGKTPVLYLCSVP
jgi:hypothetical protein